MPKNFKKIMSFIVVSFGILLSFGFDEVKAATIDSEKALKEVFKNTSVIINESNVKLTGNVTISDLVEFVDGNFVLDLNGYTLKVDEFYLVGGKLTINDATKKGIIDTRVLCVEENAILTVNQMILESSDIDGIGTPDEWEVQADLMLAEGTKVTINNGKIEHAIWNEGGDLTIKYAEVGFISQNGTTTIYDGKFTNLNVVDLDLTKTTLYGGTFDNPDDGLAVIIGAERKIDTQTIQELVADGYVALFSNFTVSSNEYDGVTYYSGDWGSTVYIIKDISDTIFDKIAPNGIWETNTLKPEKHEDSEFLLSAVAGDYDLPEGYEIYGFVKSIEPYDPSDVELWLNYNGHTVATKKVKATYVTPAKETLTAVNKIISEIEKSQNTDFILDDLYLINYLNASKKGVNYSLMLNFAKDLIELTNGGNITYKYDVRGGTSDPIGLYGGTIGNVIVYYNGQAINTTRIGLETHKVIYIPMDTEDSDSARIAAAEKRIKEYLGTLEGISIKVGRTLESLNNEGETWNYLNVFDEELTGDNYYIITINGVEYKFVISKKDTLETPVYMTSDVMSSISITSNVTTIPLDAQISVSEVTSNDIEKALGTSVYAAYDIKLYSNAKQVYITKLENGKFLVSIPVPEILKDKVITVYYITSKGEKEEHRATVKDGIATFETDHFSTYVLTEVVDNELDETPKTGIINKNDFSLIITAISLLGIGTITLKRKKYN